MSKYKLVFDTNPIWLGGNTDFDKIFNKDLEDVLAFVAEHPKLKKISLAVPEVVIRETMLQKKEAAAQLIAKLGDLGKKIRTLNISLPDVRYEENEMEVAIQKKAEDFLVKHNIEVLKIPPLELQTVTERAFKRIKPFRDEDRGLKDTLIWLSVLEDASKNVDTHYVFCTGNKKDFDHEHLMGEFKKISPANFEIVENLKNLKEYLEEK